MLLLAVLLFIVSITTVIVIGYASRRIKMIFPTGLDVRQKSSLFAPKKTVCSSLVQEVYTPVTEHQSGKPTVSLQNDL